MDRCTRELRENKDKGVFDYRLGKKLLNKLGWKNGHVVMQCEHPNEEHHDKIILLVNETKAKRLSAEQAYSLAQTLWPVGHEKGSRWEVLKKNYFQYMEDEEKAEQFYNERFEKAHTKTVVDRDGKKPAHTEVGRPLDFSPAEVRERSKFNRKHPSLPMLKMIMQKNPTPKNKRAFNEGMITHCKSRLIELENKIKELEKANKIL